ncbi:MAG: gluconokinase, partial [Paraglaciecola sp.]|uniref:gluconokinase n=1 Tax=Paraglaciecola sp. TaxID=1920173 RepID=UPI00329A7104
MILIVCGVSGTGKSTIGSQLAKKLELPFYDGDDFHPESNVQKMQSGTPLNDKDRQPWLASLAKHIASWEIDGGAVLACSALKESYRKILASSANTQVNWI